MESNADSALEVFVNITCYIEYLILENQDFIKMLNISL
jgi:hypothetical protein